jgi:hypothetical protein
MANGNDQRNPPTTGDVVPYVSDEYKLFIGKSQYPGLEDKSYCMIDVFSCPSSAKANYAALLLENGFVNDGTPTSTFWSGYDADKEYAVRLLQYDDNLSIFFYNYSTMYSD